MKDKKLRGGYYTPSSVAQFLADYCIDSPDEKILEPSAGDGKIVDAAQKSILARWPNCRPYIQAVELNKAESNKIESKNSRIFTGDFFEFSEESFEQGLQFDVVLGNPPFIRYQNFPEKMREKAFSQMRDNGFTPNRLTNIWVPFVTIASRLLVPTGKLGMVLPAEIMQVDYAAQVRRFFLKEFSEVTLVTFKYNIFSGAQQEVVLVLARKKSTTPGFRLIEVTDDTALNQLVVEDYPLLPKVSSDEKWLKYFLSKQQIREYEIACQLDKMTPLSNLIQVNVGVVTGQNKFFILDKKTEQENHLEQSTIDIISKSDQLSGIRLSEKHLKKLYEDDKRVKLFSPELPALPKQQEIEYIKLGEQSGYSSGYKTRIRKHWYEVPISWHPDGFFLRQVDKYPRIVINETEATSTDTIHKIRAIGNEDLTDIALSFINSFTFLEAELTGRSYGGGVLTFEPGEVRKIQIPIHHFNSKEVGYVEGLMAQRKVETAMSFIDKIVLVSDLGLTQKNVDILNEGWRKLQQRRLLRR